jgi:hypothetical protein
LIGLIGLGDPVYSMAARDTWIGWCQETHRRNLRHVMDAFVLGAVPPYSQLLGGKLVAALVTSDEIRAAFSARYRGTTTRITGTPFDGRLALVITTSALGRSSIYNRLSLNHRLMYCPVGWTQGSGEFQFANGLYARMFAYAREHFDPSAKHSNWGTGFRNRREVVKRCLRAFDLPPSLLYHGIQRQVFAVPLARNTREFLRGDHSRLHWITRPCKEIGEFCRERWMLPRAQREHGYLEFDPCSLRLWI